MINKSLVSLHRLLAHDTLPLVGSIHLAACWLKTPCRLLVHDTLPLIGS